MTGTTSEVKFMTGCYNWLQNQAIETYDGEDNEWPPQFDDEIKLCKKTNGKLSTGAVEESLRYYNLTREKVKTSVIDIQQVGVR